MIPYIFIDCKNWKQVLDFFFFLKAKQKAQSKINKTFKTWLFPSTLLLQYWVSLWSFEIYTFEKFLHIKDFKAVFLK